MLRTTPGGSRGFSGTLLLLLLHIQHNPQPLPSLPVLAADPELAARNRQSSCQGERRGAIWIQGSKITSLELSGFAGNLYREVTCTLTFDTIGLNDSSSSDRLLGASVTYNVSCIMCVKTKCPLKWNKTDVFKKKVEKMNIQSFSAHLRLMESLVYSGAFHHSPKHLKELWFKNNTQ